MGEHRHKRLCVAVVSFFAIALPASLSAQHQGLQPPTPAASPIESDFFQDAAFEQSFLISRTDAILEQRLERLEREWAAANKSLPSGLGSGSRNPGLDSSTGLTLGGPPASGALGALPHTRSRVAPQDSAKPQAIAAGHYSLRNYLEGHERTGPPTGTQP